MSWIRSDRTGTVRLTAGDHQVKPGELYRRKNIDKNSRTGKPYPGGLEQWGIAVSTYKEEVQNRWSIDPEKPGAWLLPVDIMYRGQGEDYLKQVTNERMSVEVLPKGGEVKRWSMISESFGNHYFDCEVHGAALADMVVGNDWSQENLDRLAAEEHRQQHDSDGVDVRPTRQDSEDFSAR
jgi:phage terminase large subunit GpA-like protein